MPPECRSATLQSNEFLRLRQKYMRMKRRHSAENGLRRNRNRRHHDDRKMCVSTETKEKKMAQSGQNENSYPKKIHSRTNVNNLCCAFGCDAFASRKILLNCRIGIALFRFRFVWRVIRCNAFFRVSFLNSLISSCRSRARPQ